MYLRGIINRTRISYESFRVYKEVSIYMTKNNVVLNDEKNLQLNKSLIVEMARINMKENNIFPYNKYEIKIWSNDHTPPHFRIKSDGWNISYEIETGKEIEVSKDGTFVMPEGKVTVTAIYSRISNPETVSACYVVLGIILLISIGTLIVQKKKENV